MKSESEDKSQQGLSLSMIVDVYTIEAEYMTEEADVNETTISRTYTHRHNCTYTYDHAHNIHTNTCTHIMFTTQLTYTMHVNFIHHAQNIGSMCLLSKTLLYSNVCSYNTIFATMC